MLKLERLFNYLFLLVPLFLITGPAIPDIVITISIIFGITYLIYFKEYYNVVKLNYFKITILFWLSLIIIIFFSFNKINSFQDSIIFIRFLFIPFFAYFIFYKKKFFINASLVLILILVTFVCIDTIYQFLNYSSENGFGEDLLGFKSNWYGRLTGPFGNELIPGSYVSKFGLLGYVFLISNKRFEKKTIIQSLYLSMVLLVTYITGERMAFATFSLGILILLIFLNGFRISILLSIILSIIFIYITIIFHPFYNDYKVIESSETHQGQKIEKFYKCSDDTEEICSKIINVQPKFLEVVKNFNTSAYGEIYLLSYKMFLDNPLTGVGINNFKYLCNTNKNYRDMMINYECASHPHNIYIQWLTEGGLIVFSLFIIYLILLTLFIIKNDGKTKYKIISLVIILIMFWPIMSTGSLIKNWYGIITFFIIGLCMCLSNFRNKT